MDDDSVPSLAEDLAARACRASILGLVILPPLLHIYSLSLLIRLAHRPDELSASGMRKMYLALLIDLAALVAGIFLIWLLLP